MPALLLLSHPVKSQDSIQKKGFLNPAEEFHPVRFASVAGTSALLLGGTFVVLNEYWYSNHSRSSFHFFNDGREWRGIDKGGHIYAGYFISRLDGGLYRWTGIGRKKSALLGSVTSILFLSTVEVLDGFSEKWGFSAWDMAANGAGAGLYLGQELLWQEQRLVMKLSMWPKQYPDELKQRAHQLFGHTLAERVLKDYNSHTFWLSANPWSFGVKKVPQWLNIAVGYGAEGMYGGFSNRWCRDASCEDVADYSHVSRISRFFLSPDVDFTKLPVRHPLAKVLMEVLNIIKFPTPTLEADSEGRVIFHWVYF